MNIKQYRGGGDFLFIVENKHCYAVNNGKRKRHNKAEKVKTRQKRRRQRHTDLCEVIVRLCCDYYQINAKTKGLRSITFYAKTLQLHIKFHVVAIEDSIQGS